MTYVCEVVYGRLGTAAIEGVNACGQCAGTGEVPRAYAEQSGACLVPAGPETQPCKRCDGGGRASRSGYAYTHDEPLSVGDLVITPANMMGGEQLATVTRLESGYTGFMSALLRVQQRAQDRTDLHPTLTEESPS